MGIVNLKQELTMLLEREVGFTGKFILERQCRSLDIDPENLCPENLEQLASRLTWAIRSYTGEKRAEEIRRNILEYKTAMQVVDGALDEKEPDMVEAQLTIAGKKLSLGLLEEASDALDVAAENLKELGKEEAKPLEARLTRMRARICTRDAEKLDEAGELYRKAIGMAEKTGQHYDVALSWAGLGALSWRLGEHQEALANYKKALKCLEPMDALSRNEKQRKRSAEALMKSGLGNVYLDLLDYDAAIKSNEEAVEIFESLDHGAEVGRVYNNLARVYEELGNYPRAIDRYERAIKHTRDSGELRMEGWALTNLASALIEHGRPDDAKEHLERAEKALRDFKDPIAHSKLNCMWGKYHREKAEWNDSTERFEESIELVENARSPDYLALAREEFGLMYLKKGDKEKARGLLESALDWYKEKKDIVHVEKVEKALRD